MLRSKPVAPLRFAARIAPALTIAIAIAAPAVPRPTRGDTIILNDGRVYVGVSDKDGLVLQIAQPTRRVMVRRTLVASSTPDEGVAGLEEIRLGHLNLVENGEMPEFAISVNAKPWNEECRREFSFVGDRRGRTTDLIQAVTVLGPKHSKIGGINRYWNADIATSELPRGIVLKLLDRIKTENLDNEDARTRLSRFLIQAEWYDEAIPELEALKADFPGNADAVERTIARVRNLRLQRDLDEIEKLVERGRPAEASRRLFALEPFEDVDDDRLKRLESTREAFRERDEARKGTLSAFRAALDGLDPADRDFLGGLILEILTVAGEAPDVVENRWRAFAAALGDPSGTTSASERAALALSGYLAGSAEATSDLELAKRMWSARELLTAYLRLASPGEGVSIVEQLAAHGLSRGQLSALFVHATPPFASDTPKGATLLRVLGWDEWDPLEYRVQLPAEYHPGRSYPLLVALHDGSGPEQAIEMWGEGASKRGYVAIAPEYLTPNLAPDYRYSSNELAAVEMAIRDARKRFSIDGDRVHVVGSRIGGNLAWDFATSRPDMVAAAGVVAGLPGKHVFAYQENARFAPLYVVGGGLVPSGDKIVMDFCRRMIERGFDTTYVSHFGRGVENILGEVEPILDWCATRRRNPYPTKFEVVAGRPGDVRHFGLVARDFQTGRAPNPAAVSPDGSNLKPAKLGAQWAPGPGLLRITAEGVAGLDVWVPPPFLAESSNIEIRVNNRALFKGRPGDDPQPMLEDFRVRGDRQQYYWHKFSTN